MNPYDLGWGNPYRLTSADMIRANIGGRMMLVRNDDTAVLANELIRRLVAAGWPGLQLDRQLDDWTYNPRLKRWAEALGHRWGQADFGEVSDHGWGTGFDFNTIRNPMLARRPAQPWPQHTDMPRNTEAIADALGFDWGGSWTEPWDPQHFGLKITPAEARRRADKIRAATGGEEDDIMAEVTRAEWDDLFRMVKNTYTQTAHLDTAGMGALARLDADRAASAAARTANAKLVDQILAELRAAGIEDGKRDAAILTGVAGIHVPDPEAYAAALAPLLRDRDINLDLDTITRAARLDIAARLTDPAAGPAA